MDPDPFIHVDETLRNAIDEGLVAGAVLIAARGADRRHELAIGHAQVSPTIRPLSSSTLFDLASLTKVLATTWLAMQLASSGHLDLDAPLEDLLPGYYPADKAGLTIRLLMCHAAGFPSGLRLRQELAPDTAGAAHRRRVIERFLDAPLAVEPGLRVLYSDIGPILVGDLLEQLGGDECRLDRTCARDVYALLDLNDTFFSHLDDPLKVALRPPEAFAATENCPWRKRLVSGEVHDENAHLLRGVAGHAGLFATAHDLERIARAYLGEADIGVDEQTLRRLTAPQAVAPEAYRAFGWDRPRSDGPSGDRLSMRAYGHTGFTGTSLWIDPDRDAYVILLSNRVHPSRTDRGFLDLRPRLHGQIIEALDS